MRIKCFLLLLHGWFLFGIVIVCWRNIWRFLALIFCTIPRIRWNGANGRLCQSSSLFFGVICGSIPSRWLVTVAITVYVSTVWVVILVLFLKSRLDFSFYLISIRRSSSYWNWLLSRLLFWLIIKVTLPRIVSSIWVNMAVCRFFIIVSWNPISSGLRSRGYLDWGNIWLFLGGHIVADSASSWYLSSSIVGLLSLFRSAFHFLNWLSEVFPGVSWSLIVNILIVTFWLLHDSSTSGEMD